LIRMAKLVLIPTPIGNLEDITLRAISMLKSADLVLAEDTRKTRILLEKYHISKKILSHHKFNEFRFIDQLIERLQKGEVIALVSDAGTPAISDPGHMLVRACIDNRIPVECLPGPTALIPALVLSGFGTERFCFEGFLPQKKGRLTRIKELAREPRTVILYESPMRIVKTLEQLARHMGPDRQASVSRELTKVYEETLRGSLEELRMHFAGTGVKGEIVLVIEGCRSR
jgi:16S rRNA (cytidine1402-2'-O)-methyltransferase